MDVIYIRSYPGQPQEVEVSPPTSAAHHRSWRVSVATNDYQPQPSTIIDPFTEIQYKTVFEKYLRNTNRPAWGHRSHARSGVNSTTSSFDAGNSLSNNNGFNNSGGFNNSNGLYQNSFLNGGSIFNTGDGPNNGNGPNHGNIFNGANGLNSSNGLNNGTGFQTKYILDTNNSTNNQLNTDDMSQTEELIQAYGETLLGQLEIKMGLLERRATDVQVYVVEHYATEAAAFSEALGPGIHCLAWELLETLQFEKLPQLSIRVTRVIDFPLRKPPRRPSLQPISAAQEDPTATIKILLVIARDFSRADRDPEPDLAQWPLMNVQKKLRSRLLLEVVRPGSFEELVDHLRIRSSQGVDFHLVHFDLHGRVKGDENGDDVPWLLFAKRFNDMEGYGYNVPETQWTKASAVAELLAEHRIENVVLNSCLSAYNRTTSTSNLSQIFLRRGIQNVSAMWFYVHWQTAATYLHTFYYELLLTGVDFHVAAQKGREAVRETPTLRNGRPSHDSFLCVNYARRAHRTDSWISRDASPSPSAMSLDSSTSNTSARSSRNTGWRASTPRLGDSIVIGDEPVIRLKLHLLQLEYKLTTFRIVYASDLHDTQSNLQYTIDRMANMWLSTNLINKVCYYRAKDFVTNWNIFSNSIPSREKTRASSRGYLSFLFPKTVTPLRQTLHIVQDVDGVLDPGRLKDESENRRNLARCGVAQERLQKFARNIEADENSYLIFLGRQDAQWCRKKLPGVSMAWWLQMPWNYKASKRYAHDSTFKPSPSRESTDMTG